MSNEIWNGVGYFPLKPGTIHPDCKWGHGNYSGNYIAFVNLVFKRFYYARLYIGKYGDKDHRARMTKHLEGLARVGWGSGVWDFEDACAHVWENIGTAYKWTDTNTKYASFPGWKMGQLIIPSVSTNFPASIVNFANAMKGEIVSIDKSFLTKSFPNIDKVINAFQNSRYDGIVEVVKEIHTQVQNVDKFLWLVPDRQQMSFGKASKAFSYTSTLTTFNQALKDIQDYESAGFNSSTSKALSALRVFAGCVPVLGGFYGEMLGHLPSFLTTMKQGFRARQQRILNYATLP